MDYNYPPVGALYNKNGSCTFTVWAPERTNVEVIVNGKDNVTRRLEKDERGYWSATLDGVEPGSTYTFRLDNDKSLPDPASRWQTKGVHGPSTIVDQEFPWTDSDWKGMDLSEMIIYELHVGTFTSQNNFEGVIAKLAYLKTLGINAIEIMPVAQFPGSRNWGYDGVYPFAVQHSYGGPTGLKKLVDAAHQYGIAVILDVVYNHQGPEGNYLSAYAPFFTDRYKTGWGKAINFDDAYCDGVRNFYWQNALMWLDEFHIDGLRMDAVHAIWDNSANHFIQELVTKVRVLGKKIGRKKVLIAELDLNSPRYINDIDKGGYGMDGQWVDEFHHALHALVTGEVDGYYEDFGETRHLVKSIKDTYVYTGEYSIHRKRHFGLLPSQNPYSQFVVFAQNHDQIGNRMLGDRLTKALSIEALKLAAAVYLLSPHVPMLFMGEEYGEKNPFQYFISHTNKELVEMVRKGRKEEFSYFKWEGEVPDPQSEETFDQCILSWQQENDPTAANLFDYYQHLIAFRKNRLAMRGAARNTVKIINTPHEKIIAFEKQHESDQLLMVFNFNKEAKSFLSPYTSPIKKIFDSSAIEWNGPGNTAESTVLSNNLFVINPETALIFEI